MTPKAFEIILEDRLKKIKDVLGHKAKEYAMDGDRLYNFKVAARILDTTQERALLGMLMKHLVSVLDLIDGKLKRTPETVDEKLGDLINYLILLEAVLLEK